MKMNFKPTKHNLFLTLVILGALFIRSLHINFQSLWLDEIYTMNMADPQNSISDIYQLSKTTDPLSVIYFILLNTLFKIFGSSAFLARFISALFGVLGVWFIYLLGREYRNKQAGLIAAFMLTVNYFHIFYSQEARVYSMYMAFTCLSFYCLLRFLNNPSNRMAVYYGISALLMILSHFFGLFILLAQIVILIVNLFYKDTLSRNKFFVQLAISFSIILIGYLPIIPIFLMLGKSESTWIQPITSNAMLELYSNFFGNSFLIVLIAVSFMLFYFFSIFKIKKEKEDVADSGTKNLLVFYILFFWLALAFFIPYVRSFLKLPMIQGRYLIGILPVFILMAAFGIDLIREKGVKISIVATFVLVSIIEIFIVKNYYFSRTKSNFRDATRYLVYNNILQSPIYTSLPYHFNYYLKVFNNKAKLSKTPINDKITNMRLGKELPEAFWAIDAHGRTFSISDSNKLYLNLDFDELKNYTGADSWALYYLPKIKKDTVGLCLKLDGLNFNNETAALLDKSLYLNENKIIESKNFNLDTGRYRLIIKAQSLPANPINKTNAHLKVYINSIPAASYYVKPQNFLVGETLYFDIKNKNNFSLKFEFDNDTIANGDDRNIIINEISIYRH